MATYLAKYGSPREVSPGGRTWCAPAAAFVASPDLDDDDEVEEESPAATRTEKIQTFINFARIMRKMAI